MPAPISLMQVLRRGAHVNDRDGLTDMTLLHYACKAGARGVGDLTCATQTVGILLDCGADASLRCRWTDMAAIHYAAYFDVSPVIELLLRASRKSGRCCTLVGKLRAADAQLKL